MAWSKERSRQRIQKFYADAPSTAVNVDTFDASYLTKRSQAIQSRLKLDGVRESPLDNIPPKTAVVVDGVHVYIQMIDFAAAMIEAERETEGTHQRVLSMLHLHYSVCDEIAENFEAQRVDFHGPRMHAVIATPVGPAFAAERAERALAFADAITKAVKEAGRITANGRYATRVRAGLDSGRSVAVNGGVQHEREPLFLGPAANYAAKLADGHVEGIFVSNRLRRDLGQQEVFGLNILNEERQRHIDLDDPSFGNKVSFQTKRANRQLIDSAASTASGRVSLSSDDASSFTFHRHTPPLGSINFADLSPSNSIRMELLSIFADIDGFTGYVDRCIATGTIGEMVANLHTIRSELAATLKDDFKGKKVRFIGDCVHGIIAEGTAMTTDPSSSVRAAVQAAGGIRSSFELCQSELDGIADLGLAIGIEYGPTPVTRIGIRGDRSVRCSVSGAVSASEDLQSKCEGDQTALGPAALQHAPANVRRLFTGGIAYGLDAQSVGDHLSAPVQISSGNVTATAASHSNVNPFTVRLR
ncbi:guanylate cyclase [Rhizobium leguminosarum bv. viciae]|uniref:guanylate cyclase n=1 Tax=Rhizobium leguminosarum TaxID=384 RepID=UPI001441EAF6|nr:guanylate cyclase [Rhizobium leguminosarum]NKK67318.1 guanylate cyclase [Rhizobium leguminosarum bv. viciae]